VTIIILVNFKLFKIVRYPVKRSPLTTPNPIAYSSNQTAIAPSSPANPIAYSSKSNSDRTLITHKTRSPFPQIKQRSPLHHPQNPIAYSQHQTAIAPQHPQHPIAYSLKSNGKRNFRLVYAS
jgi:hypothetical protein